MLAAARKNVSPQRKYRTSFYSFAQTSFLLKFIDLLYLAKTINKQKRKQMSFLISWLQFLLFSKLNIFLPDPTQPFAATSSKNSAMSAIFLIGFFSLFSRLSCVLNQSLQVLGPEAVVSVLNLAGCIAQAVRYDLSPLSSQLNSATETPASGEQTLYKFPFMKGSAA